MKDFFTIICDAAQSSDWGKKGIIRGFHTLDENVGNVGVGGFMQSCAGDVCMPSTARFGETSQPDSTFQEKISKIFFFLVQD